MASFKHTADESYELLTKIDTLYTQLEREKEKLAGVEEVLLWMIEGEEKPEV